jgi:predicted O-methyltransferase YrrM
MPIAEVSEPTAECPEPALWQCFDQQSAETEVLEFLYALVRTIKPKVAVETGTFRGLSACYIAKALRDNGRGKLITCEVDPKCRDMARDLVGKTRLAEYVDCRLESSLDLAVSESINLLFFDSLPDIRIQELDRFLPQMAPHGVIILHDVNSGFHGNLRRDILKQDKERRLSVVMLPTPRGLAICQKREGRE